MSGVGRRVIVVFALGALVAGCMVGPDYERPEIETPEGWLVDFGQPFGEQPSCLAFGWVEPGTTTTGGLHGSRYVQDARLAHDRRRRGTP